MFAFFDRDNVGLPGFAEYFRCVTVPNQLILVKVHASSRQEHLHAPFLRQNAVLHTLACMTGLEQERCAVLQAEL